MYLQYIYLQYVVMNTVEFKSQMQTQTFLS